MLAKVQATNGTFTESGLSLMMPPDYGKLPVLRNRGAKLMVYHGTADPIFSSDDTVQWYDTLRRNHGDAADFARLYLVPGMNHCSGGDRKSTRLNSSHLVISYAVFCLKKK